MLNKKREVVKPTDERQRALIAGVRTCLAHAAEIGAPAMGMTGATFTIVGLGVLAGELSPVNQHAAVRLLRAVASLFDPDATADEKKVAEAAHSEAAREIYAAVDMMMMEAQGNG